MDTDIREGTPTIVDMSKVREASPDMLEVVHRELGDIFAKHPKGKPVIAGAERLAEMAPQMKPNTMFQELQHLAALMRDVAKMADDMHNNMFGGSIEMQSGPMSVGELAKDASMSEQVSALAHETRYNIARTIKGLAVMRDYVGA